MIMIVHVSMQVPLTPLYHVDMSGPGSGAFYCSQIRTDAHSGAEFVTRHVTMVTVIGDNTIMSMRAD